MSDASNRSAGEKLGVLVSGSGTNLQALLDADLGAPIAVVISNRANALALSRAQKSDVKTLVLDHKKFSSREAYDEALVAALRAEGVTLVVLAGFMRIVTHVLLDAFPRRVVNIHPSLLPSFPGMDAQKQTFEAGVPIAGCTVHLVDAGVDSGPILAQAAVPVRPDDDLEGLRARILAEEHALLPFVVRALVESGVAETDRGVSLGRRIEVPPRPQALWSLRTQGA